MIIYIKVNLIIADEIDIPTFTLGDLFLNIILFSPYIYRYKDKIYLLWTLSYIFYKINRKIKCFKTFFRFLIDDVSFLVYNIYIKNYF